MGTKCKLNFISSAIVYLILFPLYLILFLVLQKVKSIDKFGGQPKEEKSSKSKSMSSKSFGKSFGRPLSVTTLFFLKTSFPIGPQGSRIKKFAVKGGAVVDPQSGDLVQPRLPC